MKTNISLKKIVLSSALLGCVILPATGFATNGLFGLGYGARVGVMGEILPGFTGVATYQTKSKNTFDDYRGLFANGGELDIPAVAQIGLAAKACFRHFNF